jgi:hypothetical protein
MSELLLFPQIPRFYDYESNHYVVDLKRRTYQPMN